MNTVCRTLVSASVIAAIGAGCGGGSGGGDAPGVTSPQTTSPSAIGRSVIDTPVLAPLVEFYRYSSSDPGGRDYETPTLVGNDNGDLLLVWENRVDGKILSMLYHPASGWTAPEVIATEPVVTSNFVNGPSKFLAWLDNQGNAVVKEDISLNYSSGVFNRSNYYLYAGGIWKEANNSVDGASISSLLLQLMPAIPDNSELGVLYLVGYALKPGFASDLSHPQVIRLKSDGKWEMLPPTPVLTTGETPFTDWSEYVTGVKAAGNDKGNMVLGFSINKHGVRAVKYSVAQGWGEVTILDANTSSTPLGPSIEDVAIGSDQRAAVLWHVGTTYDLNLAIDSNNHFGPPDVAPSGLRVDSPSKIHLDHQTASIFNSRSVGDSHPIDRIGINHVYGSDWDVGTVVQFEHDPKFILGGRISDSNLIDLGWVADGYMFAWTGQNTLDTRQFRTTGWTSVKQYQLVKSNLFDFTMTNARFAISGTNWVGVIRGRNGLHSVQWPIQ